MWPLAARWSPEYSILCWRMRLLFLPSMNGKERMLKMQFCDAAHLVRTYDDFQQTLFIKLLMHSVQERFGSSLPCPQKLEKSLYGQLRLDGLQWRSSGQSSSNVAAFVMLNWMQTSHSLSAFSALLLPTHGTDLGKAGFFECPPGPFRVDTKCSRGQRVSRAQLGERARQE